MRFEGLDRGSSRRVGDQQLDPGLSLEKETKDLEAAGAVKQSRYL